MYNIKKYLIRGKLNGVVEFGVISKAV